MARIIGIANQKGGVGKTTSAINIAASLAASLEKDEGWIVARRELDQEPDQGTAVYIADAGQEYGLWYQWQY